MEKGNDQKEIVETSGRDAGSFGKKKRSRREEENGKEKRIMKEEEERKRQEEAERLIISDNATTKRLKCQTKKSKVENVKTYKQQEIVAQLDSMDVRENPEDKEIKWNSRFSTHLSQEYLDLESRLEEEENVEVLPHGVVAGDEEKEESAAAKKKTKKKERRRRRQLLQNRR
ncbi:hypothetical protein QYF36_022725 [Acer negundo]|nr:hypothetical protein QYF36_022725 [Acer negundo]